MKKKDFKRNRGNNTDFADDFIRPKKVPVKKKQKQRAKMDFYHELEDLEEPDYSHRESDLESYYKDDFDENL